MLTNFSMPTTMQRSSFSNNEQSEEHKIKTSFFFVPQTPCSTGDGSLPFAKKNHSVPNFLRKEKSPTTNVLTSSFHTDLENQIEDGVLIRIPEINAGLTTDDSFRVLSHRFLKTRLGELGLIAITNERRRGCNLKKKKKGERKIRQQARVDEVKHSPQQQPERPGEAT